MLFSMMHMQKMCIRDRVSSISADKAILTVKDFSFGNYEDLSIIIKETEFSESAPLDFSISDTSLILNLSSLRSHFEFRRSKEFRIYILGVHDQKAELLSLIHISRKFFHRKVRPSPVSEYGS